MKQKFEDSENGGLVLEVYEIPWPPREIDVFRA